LLISDYSFYVTGNICRSPIAEAVFQNEVNKRGLQDQWEVKSAGIIGYHAGKKPDNRARNTLIKNGIIDYSHRARQVRFRSFQDTSEKVKVFTVKSFCCNSNSAWLFYALNSYDQIFIKEGNRMIESYCN